MFQKVKYLSCFLSITLLINIHFAFAQSKTPSNEGWRVHLPFANNYTLCESGNKIYVGSKSGVFTFDENDKSVEILSRVNGLSDVEVQLVNTCPSTGAVVVAYQDANIDIIEKNNIYNISDILSKVIIGAKNINNISFYENLAYLSCSFGIVVIDMNKKLIVDSYIGLDGGNTIEIKDVEVLNGYIYASTHIGIIRAPLNCPNLGDYNFWKFLTSPYVNNCSNMAVFKNKLYAVLDSTLQTYDGISWTVNPYPTQVKNPFSIVINHGKLLNVTSSNIFIEDEAGSVQTFPMNSLQGAVIGNNDLMYTLGYFTGLILNHPDGSKDYISPSGPYGKTAQRFAYNITDNSLWVAGGSVGGFGTTGGWGSTYNNNKFYKFTDNSWYNFDQTSDPKIINARDFIDVTINPINNHVFMSTYGTGLFEFESTSPLKYTIYDSSNTGGSIRNFNGVPMISGTCFDKKGNLWVSNFGANNPISVKTASGQWASYGIPSQIDGIATDVFLGFITCDDNNYKWVSSTHISGGIIVFDEKGDAQHMFRMLQKGNQKGAMPSNNVFCMTKDQKGEMWVGTDQGLCIFSNSSNIFKDGANYDSHQIVIKTGLVYSNFLGIEAIYCIRVDAANRKWIGTKNGVWLVSADGYTVLKNFTTLNSPLLSNIIYDVGINDKTGEVFFATDKGIISYMGNATGASDTHGDVIIYPNPVRPEYQGLISIRGLVNNANVKITDIEGNLVYETAANGGMATWNGLNLQGKRAATGVYIIYSSNSDATDTWVGKILFIN
ncbi:MAG: two-component regulator propeller domain-containing protein [Bacteroidota bacterium]